MNSVAYDGGVYDDGGDAADQYTEVREQRNVYYESSANNNNNNNGSQSLSDDVYTEQMESQNPHYGTN